MKNVMILTDLKKLLCIFNYNLNERTLFIPLERNIL